MATQNGYVIHVKSEDSEFHCQEDTSLLVGMGRVGAKYIPVGCRAGGCGVCKIRVLEGVYDVKVMSQAHVSTDEQQQGYALACRVFPRSNMLIEPYSSETLI